MFRSVLGALLLAAPSVPSQEPQLEQRPIKGSLPGTERWIVEFRAPAVDLSLLRDAIAAGAVAASTDAIVADYERRTVAARAGFTEAVARLDGRVVARWWLVPACAIEIPPRAATELAARADVRRVVPDEYRRIGAAPIRDATNLINHRTDLVHAGGVRGQGMGIAILDSGVDSNMAGSGRPHATFFINGDTNNRTGPGIGGSRLLVNAQVGAIQPDDIINHGTPVAGVAAGAPWRTTNGDSGQAPLAGVASYSLCDTPSGFTLLTTMVAAWQQVVTDRTRYGIVAANLSYEGSEPVDWIEQQAMDAAATVGDIAIAVMGGNMGPSTHYSHGATNVLAVGAVATDTHVVAPFSVRGPMNMYSQRTYPDVAANGVSLKMPNADNEAIDRIGSGTSYAAPQVAGAMALYRSQRTGTTAREARAAVLHTTESISLVNPPPANSRNAVGLGYLRVDELVALPGRAGLIHNGTLTPATSVQQLPLPVVGGGFYAATVVWDRVVTASQIWSNVDVDILDGTTVLASSTSALNSYERVQIRAPRTATLTVRVRTVTFEPGVGSVPFAAIGGPCLPFWVPGAATAYGTSCSTANLSVTGEPMIRRSYDVSLPAAGTLPAAIFLGASDQQWGPVTLPFDLTALGMPGCSLFASLTLALPATVGGGQLRATVPVPADVQLLGATVYHQAVHGWTTPAGIATTNGVRVRLGGE